MRYSSRQLEKLQQKQEQFYPVPWVPEVFLFFPFFLSVCDSWWFEEASQEKKFRNVAERWPAPFILSYM